MLLRPLDTIFAHKSINLASELSGTDKRVACAIIDSFNRTTGQCDPSLDRIARLLGISRRTVIRSVLRLERSRFIRKVRHGGKSHRNSYEPNWPRFRELETHWNVRFRAKRGHSVTANVSPSECHSSHVAGDEAGTQTFLTNSSEETSASQLISKPIGEPSKLTATKRLGNEQSVQASRNFSTIFHAKQIQSRDAARASAERHWCTDLTDRFAVTPDIHAAIIEAIDPALKDAATEAELKHRSAGLAHIVSELRTRNIQIDAAQPVPLKARNEEKSS